MSEPGVVAQIAMELERSGVDLRAMGYAWARAAPVVAVVPAFGLRALPGPVRAVMGLSIAACVAPALKTAVDPSVPWAWGLAHAAMRGIPVALATAVPLWAATMAGGAADAARSSNDAVPMPVVEGRPTPTGVLMAMLAAVAFFASGGPARVVAALASAPSPGTGMLEHVAYDLASGIQIAVSVSAPILAASVIVELAAALTARAAVPAQIHVLLAPLRAFAVLAVTALVLDRMMGMIDLLVAARPAP